MENYKWKNLALNLRDDCTEYQYESLRVLGENAAVVIHELRAPLAGIYAQLQLLERGLKSALGPQWDERFSLIYGEIKRVSNLCDQLMILAAGKKGECLPVDMAGVCSDTVALLRAMACSRGVNIDMNIGTDLPLVLGDDSQLRCLLINLVSNAIQALAGYDGEGKININLERNDQGLRLMVKDNGPGMGIDIMERIFDPFFTTKSSGSGLGLPLCADIAKSHRGELTVYSEPNQGATFVLCLPAAAD
ncbi:MAG: HAMP domain-containing histidine kinase [Clostridia bacterium]|nr:HAMP domain-containing histidine kinase [Clostridia bacterium]